jgi:hypothetical protein
MEPWCVMARIESYISKDGQALAFVHTIRCRERGAPWWRDNFGYEVVIRDSEMPQPPEIEPSQSNPRRGED